jgi:hypothetical protein
VFKKSDLESSSYVIYKYMLKMPWHNLDQLLL